MKYHKVIAFLLVSLFGTKASAEPSAEALLFQMQRGYHHNNFELVMVHLFQNSIEPLRLTHGWNNNTEITHLLTLSGRPVEYLGKNKQVTFAESAEVSYTLKESQLPGLWFSILNCSPDYLLSNYDVVRTGKTRIAGQIAQSVRLTAKDDNKYNFILWLEQKTGVLLRMDVSDSQGNVVEQYMGVDFSFLSEHSSNINSLASMKVPQAEAVKDLYRAEPSSRQWSLGWLPSGFKSRSVDQHKLPGSDELVDYFLLSDGVVDVSVYISRTEITAVRQDREQIAVHGATSILSLDRKDGINLTVVGELPLSSLRHIADTIRHTQ